MEKSSDPQKELNQNILDLSRTIKQINSFWFVFLRGIVNGVGTFIGATIVAAIVITFVAKILTFFDINLGINDYLNSHLSK